MRLALNWFKEIRSGSAHDAAMDTAVDLRGLEPPEPLLRILDALEAPGPGPLVFLLSREPLPLYALLAGGAWSHTVRRDAGGVELTLTRR